MKGVWQKTIEERDEILALLKDGPHDVKTDLEVNKRVRKFIAEREVGLSIKERLDHGAFFFDVARAALKSHANFTFDTLLSAYAKNKRSHHPSEMMLEEILSADNAHALERIIKVEPWSTKWANKMGGWETKVWKNGAVNCYNFLKNKNAKELLTKEDFKEVLKEQDPPENYIALLPYSIYSMAKLDTPYKFEKNVMMFLNQVPWLDDYFDSIKVSDKGALFLEDILFSFISLNMEYKGLISLEVKIKNAQEIVDFGCAFLECVGKRSGLEKWEQKCLEVSEGLLNSSLGFATDGYVEIVSGVHVYLSKKMLTAVAESTEGQVTHQKRRSLNVL